MVNNIILKNIRLLGGYFCFTLLYASEKIIITIRACLKFI